MTLNTTYPSEPLLHIVPSYGAVLALIFIYLAFRVVKQRRKTKVAIGDGNNPALKRSTHYTATLHNMYHFVYCSLLFLSLIMLKTTLSIYFVLRF